MAKSNMSHQSHSSHKTHETPEQKAKMGKVMEEFKEGKLKTSHGGKVTERKQAVAIGMSEAGISKTKPNHSKKSMKNK